MKHLVTLAALGGFLLVLVAPSSAQAASCSGHITATAFQFRCDTAMGSPADPSTEDVATGAQFSISLRSTSGQVVSGRVTSPAGVLTCQAIPSGTSRRGAFHTSELDCGSDTETLPAGQTVTGTWRLSSPSACTPGANLTANPTISSGATSMGALLSCGVGGGGLGGGTGATVSALRVSPFTFPAAAAGPSATPARTTGTTVIYTLSRASTVRFTVAKALAGRRVHGGCVAPTLNNRLAPRCTRYVLVRGSFTGAGRAGTNRFHFTGRMGGRKLALGGYRLVATPTGGQAKRAAFRIER